MEYKGDNMTNSEILKVLQSKRKVKAFADFLGMSRMGVFKLLKNEKKQYNQYGNYIEFIKREYER
ncbi:MAG: hypothetical protein K2G03_05460 [Bacilli bacterium]|nr:hypothetical protein [Bacilli bacterium]